MAPHSIPTGPVLDGDTPLRAAAQRLRNVLRLNASTSVIGGLIAVAAGGPLNRVLGTSSTGTVRAVGAGLVVFGITVGAASGTSIRRLQRFTPAISIADTTWVVASVATTLAGWYSTAGALLVGAVAAMVAFFAVRQLTLVRPVATLSRGSTPTAASLLDQRD